jgi:redox-sensitive bicupin YhaK (pirin superfamily)
LFGRAIHACRCSDLGDRALTGDRGRPLCENTSLGAAIALGRAVSYRLWHRIAQAVDFAPRDTTCGGDRDNAGDDDTMIELRPFSDLGAFRGEWLNARHHFSFGSWRDPARMGFGRLRVWNDDEIAPGTGFDPHPHRDMEIVTYIREGAITHLDNLGNEGRTEAGDVQVMHAGTGILHAEYNREAVPTRLFQIWIEPDRRGVAPGWSTRTFPVVGKGLSVFASGRPEDASSDALPLYANAAVLAGTLAPGEAIRLALAPGRKLYLVPVRGSVTVNGLVAHARDGVAIADETEVAIVASETAEIVAVDVAA